MTSAVESDPGVFTELISKMGATGVEVAELWSADRASLAQLEPIYGLIFLFKWQKETDIRPVDEDFQSKGVFFANQVINNACATQALISILMNVHPDTAPGFQLGSELTTLREFTADFPPDVRGLAIGNSEAIRSVHNSFHPPQPLVPEEKEDDKDGDAFHFIAFYELDGLKPGPIRICDCTPDEWLTHASEAVAARIARYSASEQRFNLMAVVRSRQELLEEKLKEAEINAEKLRKEREETARGDGDCNNNGGKSNSDTEDMKLAELESEIHELTAAVDQEKMKRKRWADENLRRRTDFTPFAFNLLKALAGEGKLQGLVNAAEEKQKERAAQ
jgi:ubiquitin carboxyl-terminal hydrolase L5